MELLVLEHAGKDLPWAQNGYLQADSLGGNPPVHQRPSPVVIPKSDLKIQVFHRLEAQVSKSGKALPGLQNRQHLFCEEF